MARYRFGSDGKSIKTSFTTYKPRLESEFGHVLTVIQALWGHAELDTYFYKLTVDERGKRMGFPPEVWDDIHMLWSIHGEIARAKEI